MVISQIYWRLTRVTKNFGKLLKMSTLSIYKLSTRCDGLRVKHYLLNGFGLTVFQNWNVIEVFEYESRERFGFIIEFLSYGITTTFSHLIFNSVIRGCYLFWLALSRPDVVKLLLQVTRKKSRFNEIIFLQ